MVEISMKTPLDSTDKEYQLWALLRQTRDAVSRARGKELKEYGISGRQSSILFTIQLIEQTGSIPTPAEIARWQFREPHTVSTLLKRMEREGLVKKVKDLDRMAEIFEVPIQVVCVRLKWLGLF